MLEVGKKVIVNNEVFQVLENDKQELTLYKIDFNGNKEEAVFDVGSEIFKKVVVELSRGKAKKSNSDKKESVLKKVQLPRKFICLAIGGLTISNALVGLAVSNEHLTLNQTSAMAIVEDEDVYSMIRNNKNLSAELKPFVRNFVERTSEVFPEYDSIYNNLGDIKYEVNREYFNNSELSSASAVYLTLENKIISNGETSIYNFINHELFHSGSTKFSMSCDKYGKSVLEGITAQLEWELFGTTSYNFDRKEAKMLALIVGSDKLSDIYLDGELPDLTKELTKYCDEEKFIEILTHADTLRKNGYTSLEDYEAIYSFYIDTFFEKLNQNILTQKSITLESYSTLIDDILKFEKISLDVNSRKHFVAKLTEFNKKIDNKFDEVKAYEESDVIKNKKEYYSNLSEDEVSYISGALSYHYTTTINNLKDGSQNVVLTTEVGANKEYINSYPTTLPDDSNTIVHIFNTDGNHTETYFNDIQYYVNEALFYNSALENSGTDELGILSSGCEYVKPSIFTKEKTYSFKIR